MQILISSNLLRKRSPSRVLAALKPPVTVGVPARSLESANRDESVVMDVAEFARRHYKVVLVTTLVGLAMAWAFSKSQSPMFRAVASIEVQDLNENFLNMKEVSPLSSAPQNNQSNDLQTQLRILHSDSLLERVLERLPREKTPPLPPVQSLLARVRGPRPVQPVTKEDVLENASRNLSVKESRQARIVDLNYESHDPQFAAAFVNRLAQQYIDQSIESRLEISRGTTAWLGKQLEDLRTQLESSENKLQAYARKSGFLVTSGDRRPAEDQLRQIQENLGKAQENRIMRQARLETAVSTPSEAVEGPAGSALREYNTKLTDLRRQRADLITVYTQDFDGVKRLDGQIGALETALRAESATILKSIQADYQDALRREKLLDDSYVRQIGRVSEQAESSIQYGILKREVDTNRDLYNTMLQRAAAARVASAMRASNARLVDLAKVPRMPFRPNPIMNLIWGGTAGLLCGLVLGAAKESFDRRIKTPGDLSAHVHVPELGAVPRINLLPTQRNSAQGSMGRHASPKPDASVEIALATWNRPVSPVADSFRGILTSIALSSQMYNTPQVISITSARPAEGKTTVAINLAAALAHVKRKVVLIDGNLREPRLHKIFDQGNDYGFVDLLELPGDNAHLLSYVTRETRIPNVWLATSGPQESGALDLLYSDGMSTLLTHAREEFDTILIDTPSLQELPDARVLGRMSDGIILVVQSGETDRHDAKAATTRLQQDGIHVLGTVLNHWIK